MKIVMILQVMGCICDGGIMCSCDFSHNLFDLLKNACTQWLNNEFSASKEDANFLTEQVIDPVKTDKFHYVTAEGGYNFAGETQGDWAKLCKDLRKLQENAKSKQGGVKSVMMMKKLVMKKSTMKKLVMKKSSMKKSVMKKITLEKSTMKKVTVKKSTMKKNRR